MLSAADGGVRCGLPGRPVSAGAGADLAGPMPCRAGPRYGGPRVQDVRGT